MTNGDVLPGKLSTGESIDTSTLIETQQSQLVPFLWQHGTMLFMEPNVVRRLIAELASQNRC